MANPTKLNKRQINYLENDGHLWWHDEYTEQQLREAVEMKTYKGPLAWEEVCNYVFHFYNKFSLEFKREARTNYIKELINKEHLEEKEATKKADEYIADTISTTIYEALGLSQDEDKEFKMLQQIKEGKFYEFINIEHMLYKE